MWHVVAIKKTFDIGARMCEFLIVASGFLVGYNHYTNPLGPTLDDCFKYTYKRLRSFYPLHIICIILYFFLRFSLTISNFDLTSLENLLATIFLVQAWSPNESTVFAYNGISWFLSALVLCYFLAPFFLKAIKNVKTSLVFFVIVALIRVGIELPIKYGADNIFNIWFHANPIVKTLEFFLGMLIVPTFCSLKNILDKKQDSNALKIGWTCVELCLPVGMYFAMFYLSSILIRAFFVLFFWVCVAIASMNYGYISRFATFKVVKKILSYQMEAFLLHLVVDEVIKKPIYWFGWDSPSNLVLWFTMKFVILMVIAGLYHEFLTNRLAKAMDKCVYFIKTKIFGAEGAAT